MAQQSQQQALYNAYLQQMVSFNLSFLMSTKFQCS